MPLWMYLDFAAVRISYKFNAQSNLPSSVSLAVTLTTCSYYVLLFCVCGIYFQELQFVEMLGLVAVMYFVIHRTCRTLWGE